MTSTDPRLPLTTRRAVSTFGLSVLGLLAANLLPFMVIALQDSLGLGVAGAGAVMTGSLLATAITCTACTRLAEGERRVLVGQAGLVLTAVASIAAALAPPVVVTVTAVVLAGAGAGGALAASGAALAALRNPNRISAANGLVNRSVVTVALAVVPLIGITTGSVFGLIAAAAAALFVVATWLPRAPAAPAVPGHLALAESTTSTTTSTGTPPARARDHRAVTVAGTALLAMYALWAVSEDSVWALAGTMGTDPAIQPNWRAQLGDERVERGYPWPAFSQAGALVAFGTDAPTAPHETLVNLYIATTRRSVIDPDLPANTPQSVVPLDEALRHATLDAAASYGAEDSVGRLAPGHSADLVVLERHPSGPDGLLGNEVVMTSAGGARSYIRAEGA